jgi:hypothetical protein
MFFFRALTARKTKSRHPLNQRGRLPVLTDAVAFLRKRRGRTHEQTVAVSDSV